MLTSEPQFSSYRLHLERVQPAELLAEARAQGLQVFAEGDQLVMVGPERLDQDLVPVLKQRKVELMPLLWITDPDEWEYFEERAAIAEFDAKLSRIEAEQLAWEAVQALRKRKVSLTQSN